MRLKGILSALLVVCILLLSACSQITTTTVQTFSQDAAGYLSDAFDSFAENFSIRSLEKSNQKISEPTYVTWNTSRHYYSQLSEKEQLAYRCIYNAVFGQPERIAVPMMEIAEFENVFTALRYDNAQLLFLDDNATLLTAGMHCYFVPVYTLSYWEAREAIEQAAAKATAIYESVQNPQSTFYTLLFLHDSLCEMCTYADVDFASQCHGALLSQTATCAGYAKALKLMADIAGIDSCVVTGNAPDESGETVNHMWLAVCVDGSWYFCDPTWDDPVSDDGRQTVEHGYFLLSEERLRLTHTDIEMPSYIVCNSEEYDYFYHNNLFCTQEQYLSVITDGIERSLLAGKDFAEFRFASSEVLQQATEDLIEAGEIYAILRSLSDYNEDLLTNRIGYTIDEKRLLMNLIFSFEE